MMKRFAAVMVAVCLMSGTALAKKPFSAEEVPDALKPWISWVSQDIQTNPCPFVAANFQDRRCVWPGELKLSLGAGGGSFSYSVSVYDPEDAQVIQLPGDSEIWPQSVTVNGAKAAVIERDGRPSLMLKAGVYTVAGEFVWDRAPMMLTLPDEAAVITLSMNGDVVALPEVEGNRLWIRRDETQAAVQEDVMNIKVFRHVIDDIPLRVETRFVLSVSGKPREKVLGKALLDGFIPLELYGDLPARLEPDGTLRVQLKPGTWALTLVARNPKPVAALAVPAKQEGWPEQEIWSFEPKTNLRLVQVEGVSSIDPSQTDMPGEWQHLPAYLMTEGSAMKLEEKKRGMSEEAPDQLTLSRQIWIDFNGRGMTVRDAINGTIRNSSRLEVLPELKLGRAAINGENQYITTVKTEKGESAPGIEVRSGFISLEADSRIEPATGSMSAVGWKNSFEQVSAVLHLPPGWTLFSYSGIDSVSDSWLTRWTLLDLFLVMVAVVSFGQLMGLRAAIIAAPALVLVHPELEAFTFLCLIVLAAVALRTYLPESRLKSFSGVVRNLTLLIILFIAVPFMIEHLREAMYPQLKESFAQQMAYGGGAGGSAMQRKDMARDEIMTMNAPAPAEMPMEMDSSLVKKERASGFASSVVSNAEPKMKQAYQYYAPNTKVQTGPGVSNWQGRPVMLRWNGSVGPEVTMSLWLISANGNLVLAFVRVLLLAALLVLLSGIPVATLRDKLRPVAALIVLGLFVMMPAQSWAQVETGIVFPPQSLLDQLKTKLEAGMNQPPACMPNCASVSRSHLSVSAQQLVLTQEISVDETSGVPLPGGAQSWRPQAVLVDGNAAQALRAGEDGYLYLRLEKGAHTVQMMGALPRSADAVGISFPLPSRHTSAAAEGWEVQGIRENGATSGAVQLIRTGQRIAAEEKGLERTVLPSFLRVERRIVLGTRFEVVTVVERIGNERQPISARIPLLAGETLLTPDVEVKNGEVVVNLGAEMSATSWQSTIEPVSEIVLKAPENTQWVEQWILEVSNLWHAEAKGLPQVYRENQATPMEGNVMPPEPAQQWQPWPGETLTIAIVRPEGIKGQTRTIDSSTLDLKAGKRTLDASLNFTLKSSLGGQHEIALPEGAVLKEVNKDGLLLPLQPKDGKLSLPLNPGEQHFSVTWQQPQALSRMFKGPVIDLGVTRSVNHNVTLSLPDDRWILLAGGPQMGPAVLFWSWLPVILILSFGLARVPLLPLQFHHWFLLLLGLSQSSVVVNFIIIGFLLVLGWRQRIATAPMGNFRFNFVQLILVLWGLIAFSCLFDSIQSGLLGAPDMKIAGNGSYGTQLKWYQDITENILPQSWVLSVSVYVYRVLMLLWALWLAFSLVKAVKWGWMCFTAGGYWRKSVKKEKAAPVENK